MIENLYLSGYRSYELGIFQGDDPKVKRIKDYLKYRLKGYLEEGLQWVIVSGNLGVEQWGVEVASELKEDYPDLQIGLVYPYADFGSQWKEKNQEKKEIIESLCDYVDSTSHKPYFSKQQLQDHQTFLLTHTQGSLLVYDEEFPGKTKYFVAASKNYEKTSPYEMELISFDDLQNFEI